MKIKSLLVSLALLLAVFSVSATRIIVFADLHALPGNDCEKKSLNPHIIKSFRNFAERQN
jgi:hypothetical protein